MTYKNIYIYEKFFRMSIQLELEERSGLKCELCGNAGSLTVLRLNQLRTEEATKTLWFAGFVMVS